MIRGAGATLRLLAAAPLLALAGCATGGPSPIPPVNGGAPAATAIVVRNGDSWTVEYRFAQLSPAWAFSRSALQQDIKRSWRPDSWKIETPGVRLTRRGFYDVLEADNGAVPSEVRIRFKPYARALATSYDPALAFTDGSVALFDGQFELFPVQSAQAAEQLPINTPAASRTAISFRDTHGQVLHGGQRHRSVTLQGAGTYVLFGPAKPIVTTSMAAVIDPRLPVWLRSFLGRTMPQMLARYADELGPAVRTKPTIMVSWAGPTPKVISMAGSNLPGLITMTFEGEGVLQERASMRNHARWFIAHEAAHFWLGQAVRYEDSRGAWITEGGADLLAIRTVQALDPGYDWKAALNESISDCAALSKGRGVASAAERGEHRAHYACGALFGLLVEQRTGRPFSEFIRPLIDANRADGVLSRAEWLAFAGERTGDPALVAWIETTLDRGQDDPAAAIATELHRAGIPFERGEGGVPRLR